MSTRSPVLAIVGSLAFGALLAVALLLGPASGGSEPLVTGSVLLAFGLGWGLMAVLTTRFSAQPQAWMAVPCRVPRLDRARPDRVPAESGRHGPAELGLAAGAGHPGDLDGRADPAPLRGRGRWLVVPVIATLLVFAVGGAITTVGGATASSAPAQTGRMIDVGGHRLYIECTGTGSPVVVLQSGLGESSSYWGSIAPAVAASTTVCTYDRAGHGRSDEAAVAGWDRPCDRPPHPA